MKTLSDQALEQATALVREVGLELVLPRWRTLEAAEISQKAPNDLVTAVDHASEAELTRRLAQIAPLPVVGEEATAADPTTLDLLAAGQDCWIVDPIDGTGNFARGSPVFAVMVALVMGGQTVASWIHQPVEDQMFEARAGAGAWRNGERLRVNAGVKVLEAADAGIYTGFLPEPLKSSVEALLPTFRSNGVFNCAGFEYAALASGQKDLALAYRALPWDHAPGLLLAAEAGLTTGRFDGRAYAPTDLGPGLLTASSPELWRQARDLMIPEADRR
jgi:fructose-1,6-bisphosphatase/inositol monophosphatase family enzyme